MLRALEKHPDRRQRRHGPLGHLGAGRMVVAQAAQVAIDEHLHVSRPQQRREGAAHPHEAVGERIGERGAFGVLARVNGGARHAGHREVHAEPRGDHADRHGRRSGHLVESPEEEREHRRGGAHRADPHEPQEEGERGGRRRAPHPRAVRALRRARHGEQAVARRRGRHAGQQREEARRLRRQEDVRAARRVRVRQRRLLDGLELRVCARARLRAGRSAQAGRGNAAGDGSRVSVSVSVSLGAHARGAARTLQGVHPSLPARARARVQRRRPSLRRRRAPGRRRRRSSGFAR